MGQTFYNNTLGAYTAALVTLVGLLVLFMLTKRFLVSYLGKLAQKTKGDFDDLLVRLLSQIGGGVFVMAALYIATLPLALNERLSAAIRGALILVITVRIVLMLQEILKYQIHKAYRRARPKDANAVTVADNIASVLRWAVWALALVFILDNFGVNITTLVAGLGIGGIAIAFASQAILNDLFSALSILVDKPFEVGDFITVENLMGTVEYIGLKTTRVRSLEGERIIFSNADLTKSRIRNYKWLVTKRASLKIPVSYDTPADRLTRIPEIVKQIFSQFKDLKLDFVWLSNFGDISLVYEVVYFVEAQKFIQSQHEIGTALKEAFDRHGILWGCLNKFQAIEKPKLAA